MREYIVISQDEPTGYIGKVNLMEIPMVCGVIRFNDAMYVVANKEQTYSSRKLYVRKVVYIEETTLIAEEYASDIRKKTIGEVYGFIEGNHIETQYYTGGIRLVYVPSDNVSEGYMAYGCDLPEALLKLRNYMIKGGVIKRGEW